jgi:hypothetical protein
MMEEITNLNEKAFKQAYVEYGAEIRRRMKGYIGKPLTAKRKYRMINLLLAVKHPPISDRIPPLFSFKFPETQEKGVYRVEVQYRPAFPELEP